MPGLMPEKDTCDLDLTLPACLLEQARTTFPTGGRTRTGHLPRQVEQVEDGGGGGAGWEGRRRQPPWRWGGRDP